MTTFTSPDNADPESSSSAPPSAPLALDPQAWQHDADHDVHYVLGQPYLGNPQAPEIETLAIFVPGSYFTGAANPGGTHTVAVDPEGKVGRFTAATAPIVLPVNTFGYMGQKPLTNYTYSDVSEFLEAGLVYVHVGCRGQDTQTASYDGNAPWAVAALKGAVRYLRLNADVLPGNTEAIFCFGHSGGGAQTAILGASELYTPYLATLGAALTDARGNKLSDAITGAMCWCPVTSLDEANAAYEWNMGQFATTGTRADGTWTKQYSNDLAAAFGPYLNSLGLQDAQGQLLQLEESANGIWLKGSYHDHIVRVVEDSLNDFLGYTSFPYTPDTTMMAGMNGTGGASGAAAQGGAGAPGMPPFPMPEDEEPVTYETLDDYLAHLNQDSDWVSYDPDTKRATVTDLAGFVRSQKRATKDVGAFDGVDRGQTENVVMGLNTAGLHYSRTSGEVIAANQSAYEQLAGWKDDHAATGYTSDMARTDSLGKDVAYRMDMYNPMYYVSTAYNGHGTSTVAPHWRIRTGIQQGDTASTVEVNLALALAQLPEVTDVDFKTVWGLKHTTAETTGTPTTNLVDWVTRSVA